MAKAIKGYQKAAKAGHAGAQNNLGVFYDFGISVPADPGKAQDLYVVSAAQGFSDAQYNIGLNYANGVAVPQDWVKAKQWYEKAAAQGHLAAQNNLGNIFSLGRGVPVDYDVARKYLQKPADAGLAVSQFGLAGTYLAQNRFTEALPWIRHSAEGGYAGGQFYWAAALWEGMGVTKDLAEAIKWARKAEAGSTGSLAKMAPEAHALVAQILLLSHNPKDETETFHAAKAAAEAGNARGQHILGVCFQFGIGVDLDLFTAIRWLRLAAAQKYAESAATLGMLSEQGLGMERSYTEAARWYRDAADGGNAVAMYRLGLFYRDGTGVETDLATAAKWLRAVLLKLPNDQDATSALADVEGQLKKR